MHNVTICGWFFLLGAFLGIIYDIFKILRSFMKSNFIVFFVDIFYFVIYTFLIFILNILINMGHMRYFFVEISFLGTIIYKFTVSKLIFYAFKKTNYFFQKKIIKKSLLVEFHKKM